MVYRVKVQRVHRGYNVFTSFIRTVTGIWRSFVLKLNAFNVITMTMNNVITVSMNIV